MFNSYPQVLRGYGLRADASTLLDIMRAMQKGLAQNLGDLYEVGRAIIVKKREETGPYTAAFFDYFLGIKIEPGETLDSAVIRSQSFKNWLEGVRKRLNLDVSSVDGLVNQFLDETLETSQVSSSLTPIEQLKDRLYQGQSERAAHSNTVGDYREKDIEELLERMKEVAKRQKGAHSGGGNWIGKDGYSPYGHSGRAEGGIRVGGRGWAQQARRVIADPSYYPVDVNEELGDNNTDAALAALRGVLEESTHRELDIDATIKEGAERGGIFVPRLKESLDEVLQAMIFIDNGGYSMEPYVPIVTKLFGKMKTRFTHDLKVFYFHNIPDKTVYSDEKRQENPIPLERILQYSTEHRVFIIGDASMNPFELQFPIWRYDEHDSFPQIQYLEPIKYLRQMQERFPRIAWLNPKLKERWGNVKGFKTINAIKAIIEMFPLTPKGIEDAVLYMNRKRHEKGLAKGVNRV